MRYKYIGIFLISILVYNICYSQNQKKIDSLKQRFYVSLSTKQKINLNCDDIGLLNEIGYEFYEKQNDSAIYYYEKAIVFLKKIECKIELADAYNSLGRCLYYKSEFKKAINYYNQAANLCIKLQDYKTLSDVYFNIAEANMLLNNLPKALDYLYKTKNLCEKNHDSVGVAQVYNYFGILYYKQGKRDLERHSYMEAVKILKTNKSEDAQSLKRVIEFNLAIYYRDTKEYLKALPVFLEQYNYEQAKNSIKRYNTASAIGSIYVELENYTKAKYYLDIALKGSLENENSSILADTYRQFGNLYFKQSKYEKAIEFTEKGLKLSKQIGELESIKFANQNLSKYYEKYGNYKKALEFYVNYKTVSDSIFNEKVDSDLKQLQLDFELQQQQQVFDLEKKTSEGIILEQQKSKKILWYGFVVTMLFLTTLILVIYQNLKNTRKQKNDIETTLEEKRVLLREIHHRVKNNLQIVNSLLNIQAQGITDEKVLNAIKEGQNRVQMMSLIHQNLYQSKRLSNIEIKGYVKDLVGYLKQIFIGDSNKIKIHLDTEDVQFDFDTAVPLGLILNELISNAFNHGFKTLENGNIWIKITSINNIDYSLFVNNDGNKIPENFDIDKTNSLGFKLVQILARQLRGRLEIEQKDNISSFKVFFKDLKQYQKTFN